MTTDTELIQALSLNAASAQVALDDLMQKITSDERGNGAAEDIEAALVNHFVHCGAVVDTFCLEVACQRKRLKLAKLFLAMDVLPNELSFLHSLSDAGLTELLLDTGVMPTEKVWKQGLMQENKAIMDKLSIQPCEFVSAVATSVLDANVQLNMPTLQRLVENFGAVPQGIHLRRYCGRWVAKDDAAAYLVESGADYLEKIGSRAGWSARTWAKRHGMVQTIAAIERLERIKKMRPRLEKVATRARKRSSEQQLPPLRRAM